MEEKIFFEGNFGKICGIYNKAQNSKEIVIICHGFSSHKNTSAKISAELLDSINISSLRIDFDNQGESDLDFATQVNVENYVEQIKTTYEICKELGYNQISLIGTSFGGICVGVATYELQKEKKPISKLCMRCPVINNSTALRWEFKNRDFDKMLESGVYEYYSEKKDTTFTIDFK